MGYDAASGERNLAMHTNAEPALPLRRIQATQTVRLALVVGALGVVFGDIGTSPIYTIQTVFNPAIRTRCRSARTTCTASCR